jgi:hypothetical protein
LTTIVSVLPIICASSIRNCRYKQKWNYQDKTSAHDAHPTGLRGIGHTRYCCKNAFSRLCGKESQQPQRDRDQRIPAGNPFAGSVICEAVTRANMRFVPTKTPEQQSCLMLHRTRHLFIRQQTAVINSIRAHLAELGIVAPVGRKGVTELLHVVADPSDKRAERTLDASGDAKRRRAYLGGLADQYPHAGTGLPAAEILDLRHVDRDTARR